MKKGTAIKEDNKARQFASVQKVVINNTSSGTSLWVPEDIAETDELYVTENGVYCAYDDNVFGYSQVVVNVSESLNDRSEKDKAISKITGTNPDTGDTESYGVDEDGNLTKEVIPSGLPTAIHIVIAPTKKTYNEGDSLDFTGIHVYLLDGEGHQWTSDEYPTGEIPFNELIFPVTVASTSGINEYQSSDGLVTAVRFLLTDPIDGNYGAHYFADLSHPIVCKSPDNYDASYLGSGSAYDLYVARYSDYIYLASSLSAGSSLKVLNVVNNHVETTGTQIGSSFIGNGAFDHRNDFSEEFGNIPISGTDPLDYSLSDFDAVLNHIPVQWVRSDGQTLEDTYQITVTANSQPASGGSSSGGEHTGGDF